MASIVEQTPFNEYTGNGVTTAFGFEFQLLNNGDFVASIDGVEIPSSDYTLSSLTQAGGTCTFDTAPANGAAVLLQRVIALARDTDYQYNGDLREETLDRDLNRLWQALQGQAAGLGGALRLPYPEQAGELPAAADRAGKTLSFHPTTGDVMLNVPADGTAASLAMQLASTASASDGDALVGSLRSETGSVAGTLHFWVQRSRLPLTNFLTTAECDDIMGGTGSIDVAAKFTTAMQQAAAKGGNRGAFLELPFGKIKIADAIAPGNISRVWVEGEGQGTLIQTSSGTADIFTLGDGTNECSGFVFSDFQIWADSAKSAGYAFNCRFLTDSEWHRVYAGSNDLYAAAGGHRLFRGWYFNYWDTATIMGGQCVTSSDGVQARGQIGDTFASELILDGGLRFFRQNASGACAVRIGGCCGGVYLRRMDASLCEKGLVIDTTLQTGGTTATRRNREVFVEGANFDSCTSWGIHQVADSVALLQMDKPWAANCGATDGSSGGVLLEGGSTVGPYVEITGPNFYLNKGAGISIEGVSFVGIDGGRIQQNGQSANGGHGIQFGATLPVRFSVGGTDLNNNGNVTKGYGIKIPAGLDNFSINGATFFSNGQGAIDNAAGFSTTKRVRDCLGYVTENSGVATVANATSSVTVTHGMTVTPAVIHITPLGAPSVGTYSAGAVGATTFDIDNGAVAAGARQFFWRASVTGD